MVLVTGGSGFIGSHIVKRLVNDGNSVRVLARDKTRLEKEGRLRDLDIEIFVGDVTQPDTLVAAMEGVDCVVHTVAIAIEKGNTTYEQVNYQGTVNVVKTAVEAGVMRLINISQLGASTSLPYRMLASKGKAQEYVAQTELDWTTFRPSVVWGPEDEFANTFARLVAITPVIFPIIGDKNTNFQPIWVGDVAATISSSIGDPTTFQEEYDLGGPEVLTLEDMERRILSALDARRVLLRFPLPLLKLFVSLMEAFLPAPPVTSSLLELLNVSNVTEQNALSQFVTDPSAFTTDKLSAYMKDFRIRDTLSQYLGRQP